MKDISEREIAKMLTGTLGGELQIFDVIDSTNNAAKLLAKNGAAHGAAVIARRQTAGRGRISRTFFSDAGGGVYLSVILRLGLAVEKSTVVTAAAAVAAARAIERVAGLSVKIKWVNDLYMHGKKLCGILAESSVGAGGGYAESAVGAGGCAESAVGAGGCAEYIVVGIGINVTSASIPPELSDTVTSLSALGAAEIDPNALIAAVLNELSVLCAKLESMSFLPEYRERSCVIGKEVTVVRGDEAAPAFALEIDENARLIVKFPDGTVETLGSGEVSLRGNWK